MPLNTAGYCTLFMTCLVHFPSNFVWPEARRELLFLAPKFLIGARKGEDDRILLLPLAARSYGGTGES